MGGAERTARKRRQERLAAAQQAKQPAGEKKAGDNNPTTQVDRARVKRVALGVGAAAVGIAVVLGFVAWTNAQKNATEGRVIPAKSEAALPEKRDGAVVVVGHARAHAVIDVYADFLCPACGQFEKQWSKQIRDRVEAGDLRVRQHMVPMLDEASDPPGYSMDSANAALCAADEGKFTAFHDSLYASQPEEGARGWDKAQLTRLGNDLGLHGTGFAACVAENRYEKDLQASFKQAVKDVPDFSTPAVVVDGKRVDTANPRWLDNTFA